MSRLIKMLLIAVLLALPFVFASVYLVFCIIIMSNRLHSRLTLLTTKYCITLSRYTPSKWMNKLILWGNIQPYWFDLTKNTTKKRESIVTLIRLPLLRFLLRGTKRKNFLLDVRKTGHYIKTHLDQSFGCLEEVLLSLRLCAFLMPVYDSLSGDTVFVVQNLENTQSVNMIEKEDWDHLE